MFYRNLQSALLPLLISLSFEDSLVVVAYFFPYLFLSTFSFGHCLTAFSLLLQLSCVRLHKVVCWPVSLWLLVPHYFLALFGLFLALLTPCMPLHLQLSVLIFHFFYEIYFCVTCSTHKCAVGLLFPLSSLH